MIFEFMWPACDVDAENGGPFVGGLGGPFVGGLGGPFVGGPLGFGCPPPLGCPGSLAGIDNVKIEDGLMQDGLSGDTLLPSSYEEAAESSGPEQPPPKRKRVESRPLHHKNPPMTAKPPKQRRAPLPSLPKRLVPIADRARLYNDALSNRSCLTRGKLNVSAVVNFYRQSPVIQAVEQYYKLSARYNPHSGESAEFYGDSEVARGISQYVRNLVNCRDLSRIATVVAQEDSEKIIRTVVST